MDIVYFPTQQLFFKTYLKIDVCFLFTEKGFFKDDSMAGLTAEFKNQVKHDFRMSTTSRVLSLSLIL